MVNKTAVIGLVSGFLLWAFSWGLFVFTAAPFFVQGYAISVFNMIGMIVGIVFIIYIIKKKDLLESGSYFLRGIMTSYVLSSFLLAPLFSYLRLSPLWIG